MTTKEEYLSAAEIAALLKALPELDWIKPEDWQAVAGFADWRTLIDEIAYKRRLSDADWDGLLEKLLTKKTWRKHFRKSCRDYFGPDNVENINDPSDPTWA